MATTETTAIVSSVMVHVYDPGDIIVKRRSDGTVWLNVGSVLTVFLHTPEVFQELKNAVNAVPESPPVVTQSDGPAWQPGMAGVWKTP